MLNMPITQARHAQITRAMISYTNSIRNLAKRRYACDYAQYLLTCCTKPDDPSDLSYMAAQAVRMRLNEIAEGA